MKAEMRAMSRHVEREMSRVERAKVRKRSVGMPRRKDWMARKVCHMLMCGRQGGVVGHTASLGLRFAKTRRSLSFCSRCWGGRRRSVVVWSEVLMLPAVRWSCDPTVPAACCACEMRADIVDGW